MAIYKKTIIKKSLSQIEFIDITEDVNEVVKESKLNDGQVLVYAPHSTAGIAVNENESLLLQDFQRLMYKLVPVDERYSHDLFELKKATRSDGRSNGHSHCKSLILGVSEVIPIEKGRIMLGEHQNIFLVELDGSRDRDIFIQVMGE